MSCGWVRGRVTQIQLVLNFVGGEQKKFILVQKNVCDLWSIVILRPLKVEIQRSALSTNGLHSKSFIEHQQSLFLTIQFYRDNEKGNDSNGIIGCKQWSKIHSTWVGDQIKPHHLSLGMSTLSTHWWPLERRNIQQWHLPNKRLLRGAARDKSPPSVHYSVSTLFLSLLT